MKRKTFRYPNLLAGPLLFFIIYYWRIDGLSHEGQAVLAATIWVAYWWITEAVELPVTSLLPVVIFPLSGALPLGETTSSYGNPFIFLFLGGFLIGLAIERWHLHQRIAWVIISKTDMSEKKVLLGFMAATAFLSMWISNTATAIMMLPIGASVISQFGKRSRFAQRMMLGIAYSASIGGMGTLVGTPPNIILAGVVKESMNVEISFLSWMVFAVPFSILLLAAGWLYLSGGLQKEAQTDMNFPVQSLGKMTIAEQRVLIIFSLTAFFWLTRTLIWNRFIPQMDDTIIAVSGALLMFIVPSGKGKGKLLNWKTGKRVPWDVLLIFGAGLAIARGFSKTDLTAWVAQSFTQINLYPFVVLLIIIASINFLTEITSNTATASIMLPLLYSMCIPLKMDPLTVLAGAALACSCAFMLPVATPPNAIVFSSGHIRIKDMIQKGLFMNILSILLIFIFVKLFIGIIN